MRAGSVIGACGLVLLGSGIAHAVTIPDSLLSAAADAGLGTVTGTVQGVVCNNRLGHIHYKSPVLRSGHACINGPVHSGNSLHSGNFVNHGNPNGSGNLANTNGSTNSADSASGSSTASSNNIQRLLGGLLLR
ncbi:hypothetical protein [Streptomyces sp. NPDC054765]